MGLHAALQVDAQCEAKDLNGCWWGATVISKNCDDDEVTYVLEIDDGQSTIWDHIPREQLRMKTDCQEEYKSVIEEFEIAEKQKNSKLCDELQNKMSFLESGNWVSIRDGDHCEVKNHKTEPWTVVLYNNKTSEQYSHVRHSRVVNHPIQSQTSYEGLDKNGIWWEIIIQSCTETDFGYIYTATVADEASTHWEGLHEEHIRSLSCGTHRHHVRKEKQLPKREKCLAEVEESERRIWRHLPSANAASPAVSTYHQKGKSKKSGKSHSSNKKVSSSRKGHKKRDNSSASQRREEMRPNLLAHQVLWIQGNDMKRKSEIQIDTPGTYFIAPEIPTNCRECSFRVKILKNKSRGMRLGISSQKEGSKLQLNHVQCGQPVKLGVGDVYVDCNRETKTIDWKHSSNDNPPEFRLPDVFVTNTISLFITIHDKDVVIVYPPLVAESKVMLPPSLNGIFNLISGDVSSAITAAVGLSVESVVNFSHVIPILAAVICITSAHTKRLRRRSKQRGATPSCCASQ